MERPKSLLQTRWRPLKEKFPPDEVQGPLVEGDIVVGQQELTSGMKHLIQHYHYLGRVLTGTGKQGSQTQVETLDFE